MGSKRNDEVIGKDRDIATIQDTGNMIGEEERAEGGVTKGVEVAAGVGVEAEARGEGLEVGARKDIAEDTEVEANTPLVIADVMIDVREAVTEVATRLVVTGRT